MQGVRGGVRGIPGRAQGVRAFAVPTGVPHRRGPSPFDCRPRRGGCGPAPRGAMSGSAPPERRTGFPLAEVGLPFWTAWESFFCPPRVLTEALDNSDAPAPMRRRSCGGLRTDRPAASRPVVGPSSRLAGRLRRRGRSPPKGRLAGYVEPASPPVAPPSRRLRCETRRADSACAIARPRDPFHEPTEYQRPPVWEVTFQVVFAKPVENWEITLQTLGANQDAAEYPIRSPEKQLTFGFTFQQEKSIPVQLRSLRELCFSRPTKCGGSAC